MAAFPELRRHPTRSSNGRLSTRSCPLRRAVSSAIRDIGAAGSALTGIAHSIIFLIDSYMVLDVKPRS
jgi:hypothetical protein